MGIHMNEDYLDSLLQSILDMEEKEEEAAPAASETIVEQSQDNPVSQTQDIGLSDFTAEDTGFQPDVPLSNRENEDFGSGLGYDTGVYNSELENNGVDLGTDSVISDNSESSWTNAFTEIDGNTQTQMTNSNIDMNDIGMNDIDMSDIDNLLRSVGGSNIPEDDEEDSQMSEDEIENLLRQMKESKGAEVPTDSEYTGGEEWQDIQDLLTKADENEAIDDGILNLLNDETPRKALNLDEQEESEETSKQQKRSEKKAAAQKAKEEKAAKKQELLEAKEREKEAKKAAKRTRKGKKAGTSNSQDEQATDSSQGDNLFQMERLYDAEDSFNADQILSDLGADSEQSSKKKGILAKALDFLLEEEEEEAKEEKPVKEKKEKKAPKAKKAKKDSKKGKPASGKNDGEDDEDEIPTAKGKAKDKKPKKKKEPQAAASTEPPVKLSSKKIIAIGTLCATICAAILVYTMILSDYSAKQIAMKAYKSGNYIKCYMDLYGKNLNEEETFWFRRSECILHAQLPLKQYQVLASRDSKTEGLDVLIQFVVRFPMIQARAAALQAETECMAAYEEALTILQLSYGLSGEQALAIAAEEDDLLYTQMVTSIAKGGSYQSFGNEASEKEENIPMNDVLPEEEGLPDVTFVEGI
jgi:hypothetical protein